MRILVILTAFLAGACAHGSAVVDERMSPVSSSPLAAPPETGAVASPQPIADSPIDLLTIGGTVLVAGSGAEVFFNVPDLRGTVFVMQTETSAGWKDSYLLNATESAEWAGDCHADWVAAGELVDHFDIGYTGVGGGLFVTLPDTAVGIYRICTENEELCSGPFDL
ncbi:hypothetical protein BH24ACT15_BH24ACT15_33560 [soil metagenome]